MTTETKVKRFGNPYRPGAGHMPPYLAGRETEKREFGRLLEQEIILQNLVLTGLRGVGKTVLLDTLKPLAIDAGWLWVGTDMSESTSVNEANIALRLITDLSVVTSTLVFKTEEKRGAGLTGTAKIVEHTLDFKTLLTFYTDAPGLVADRLKYVLEMSWRHLKVLDRRGIIFAYDEAQNLADHADKDQFPLSLLLDVFQSIQRKEIPFMLVLTGLPTLFPKLVEARTYTERMFHVMTLNQLNEKDTAAAVLEPIKKAKCPVSFTDQAVKTITGITGGYPYFIQYVCREAFDIWVLQADSGQPPGPIPVEEITRKLDTDFFAGRWARVTDRQRELLGLIASLNKARLSEFTIQEVVEASKGLEKPFSASHVSQLLSALSMAGLVYKNRWGKHLFAVPMLDEFIRRQRLGNPDPLASRAAPGRH